MLICGRVADQSIPPLGLKSSPQPLCTRLIPQTVGAAGNKVVGVVFHEITPHRDAVFVRVSLHDDRSVVRVIAELFTFKDYCHGFVFLVCERRGITPPPPGLLVFPRPSRPGWRHLRDHEAQAAPPPRRYLRRSVSAGSSARRREGRSYAPQPSLLSYRLFAASPGVPTPSPFSLPAPG